MVAYIVFMEHVFKAMADESRRFLLDELFRKDGQTLQQLSVHLRMSRQAVSKHLRILQDAQLVSIAWHGREKFHYLNPIPIREVMDRWIAKYNRPLLEKMFQIKNGLENPKREQQMEPPVHVYEIYIKTEPQSLWHALTTPEFTRQYFHSTLIESDWQVGSPVVYRMDDGTVAVDGVVLESKPYERLSFSWHVHYSPELESEGATRVVFEIEQINDTCRLKLTHDQFIEASALYDQVSKGWTAIMSSLKSLLETGCALAVSN